MSKVIENLEINRVMKDSGIKWMGEIPKEWSVVKYKTFSHNTKGETILKTDVTNDGIPVYSASKDGEIFGYIKSAKKILSYGDLVIPARGTIGITHFITDEIATCTQTTICSKLKDVNKRFIYHCSCGLKEYWFEFTQTAVPQLTVEQVKNNLVPHPPLHEQQAIANYLDEKVEKIDQLIAEQNQSIDKWKEYKQSLITETVTKGLNPNVEMKDSGIEWIGKIPSNWDKRKISNLFTLIGSGTTPTSSDLKYYDDGEIPWLNTGDLNDGYLYTPKNKITSHALNDYSTLKMYPEDTLIVAMYGATIGKLGITTYKTTTNQACCALSNPKNCITKFIFYWFYGNKTEIINLSRGAGQPNISQNIIKNLILFIPPLHEQQAIAEFLDEKVERVDQAIEQKQTLIKQLEEYKQSLIYECVTGKIEVRER